MKNTLVHLQNHLFEMIETLNDQEFKGEELDEVIKRSLALNELAKTAVTNGALMVKAADTLYGLPVSDDLPLIPKSPAENPAILSGDRKSLVSLKKAGK